MEVRVEKLKVEHVLQFKHDMQEAFQKSAEAEFGKIDGMILPDSHIVHHMSAAGAVAFEATVEGGVVGGAVVEVHEKTQRNQLSLLYVKVGEQGKGIGISVWQAIEALFPNTLVWETNTPYFDKRNIHFYLNRCGFHAVEFFCQHHPEIGGFDDDLPRSEYFEAMFRFEKVTKNEKNKAQ